MLINFSTRPFMKLIHTSIISLLIASCSVLYFYREIHELEGMQWLRSDKQHFIVTADEPKTLDGRLIIRHIEGYQFQDLTVHVSVTHNGETWMDEDILVPIRDENGDYLGQGSVDLWDVEHALFQGKTLLKGEYSFTIEHTMQQDRIPLVMEVGLVLEEV